MTMKTFAPILVLLTSAAFAAEDPFVRANAKAPAPAPQGPPVLSVTYEAFSISLDQAAALQRKNPGDAGFYNDLVARTARGEAKQECLFVVSGRSGQKITGGNATEALYATEYQEGAISPRSTEPQTPAIVGKPEATPAVTPVISPAVPSAIEDRNCGFELEIEPVLSEDLSIVDLRLVPTHVTFAGREKWGQGASETEMPLFDTQRITGMVSAVPGSPCLIGTISKVEIPRPRESSARRVWFAFVTVDIVKQ
jgi:hypothetical protein